ncbi:MAG: MltA domain-containing protein [Robiginitomaculum sp.]|nr:MltA domain-containing protein [Robiginitomaculum sp.]
MKNSTQIRQTLVFVACFGLAACVTTSQPAPPVEPVIPAFPTPEPPAPIPDAAPRADADGIIRQKVTFGELPGWQTGSTMPAFRAFLGSCAKFARTKNSHPRWRKPCEQAGQLEGVTDEVAQQFFESEFTPFFVSVAETDQGLLTAYYEPELEVQEQQSPEFSEPILARPSDLVTVSLRRLDPGLPDKILVGQVRNGQLETYFSRQEIRQKPGKPLAWGRAIDVFFLQIQGSGRIRFASGKTARAAFAGHNGQKYHSIGKELISRGELQPGKASKAAIENWMQQAGPQGAQELMNTNPRYIFFQEQVITDPNIGPNGTQGVALTAQGSIAIDAAYHPFGMPIWIDSRLPKSPSDWKGEARQFLVIAQDTGGAIKGPLRGDLFYGSGDKAGKLAGIQKHPAKWWTLLPNEMAKLRETGA